MPVSGWTDGLATLAATTAHFREVLAQVRPEQLDASTPCPDWRVRDLVQHVAVGNRWASLLLRGAEPGPAMGQAKAVGRTGDLLPDFDADTASQAAAFAEEGAETRVVQHFLGPVPAGQFLAMRSGDVLIHSWDLARATGADERLPQPLVQVGLAIYEARAASLAATGMFGSGGEGAPAPTTDQDRLLHLTGRRP
jgi:uncharacterized protein (TIGR03086 family)